MLIRRPVVVLLCLASLWPRPAAAQTPQTGSEMYGAWCAACHAPDGTGRVATRLVPTPAPDFTKCRRTTSEADVDWQLVITRGGSAAGLSYDMPAFETLSDDQAAKLVGYVRTFCAETGWPSGNFNLPRALFTAKAFPDSEAALQPMVSHSPTIYPYGQLAGTYGQRIGKRAHVEFTLPVDTVNWVTGRVTGIGDVGIEGSYMLNPGRRWSTLYAAGLEVTLPTGSRQWQFGEGTAVFEPFLAAGGTWHNFYVQADVRGRFLQRKLEPEEITRFLLYNVAISRDVTAMPTSWTLGIELNGLNEGFALTPQIRKGLTRSGSLSAAFGVQLPIRLRAREFSGTVRWTGYLLWDYLETLRRRRTAIR